MQISGKYSHLNGLEYLMVHHKQTLNEIFDIIKSIDAAKHLSKKSLEKNKKGKFVLNPRSLNQAFKTLLYEKGWEERRRNFFVSIDPNIVKMIEPLDYQSQKKVLKEINHPLFDSYNQTDFLKDRIAVEVQLGKYFAVTYDLFVKHLSFYAGQIIDVGIEIVPMKAMQKNMSSGPPWFEKEVHNVLRHGRTNPPVPLLIIGIEP